MAMDREKAVSIMNTHPALSREILRCEVGSTSHGVSLAGTDDFDMMAIGIPRPEYVLGTKAFDTFIYRTAEEREGKKSVPSQPGDVDLCIHSLKKFCHLAAKGNPSVQLMLFAPVMKEDDLGRILRAQASLFASKDVGRSFLGYMIAQMQRLKGERGQMRTTRQPLIDKYGFDTKYAMHVLRLGYQGLGFMETGCIECPIVGPFRNFLLGVRQGQHSFDAVVAMAGQMEADLKAAIDKSHLPEHADHDGIDRLLESFHLEAWGLGHGTR
jgi:predicted nucleotidyltransferase